MDYTQHYNLKKPAYGEAVDVKDLNDNADITDAQLNTLAGLVAARLLKTDLTNQIINDATKVASAATVYSVNKKADDINSDLGDLMSNTFTSDTTHMLNGVTANEFNYAKFGHIATVSGLINPSAVTTTGEVKIHTLPETYRPSRAIYFSIASNNSAITMTYGVIRTDGSVLIQLNDAVAKGSHKLFSVSYYVA